MVERSPKIFANEEKATTKSVLLPPIKKRRKQQQHTHKKPKLDVRKGDHTADNAYRS